MTEIDRFVGSNGSHETKIQDLGLTLFSPEKLQEIAKSNGNGRESTDIIETIPIQTNPMFTGIGSEAVRISRRKEQQRQLGFQIARRRLVVRRR